MGGQSPGLGEDRCRAPVCGPLLQLPQVTLTALVGVGPSSTSSFRISGVPAGRITSCSLRVPPTHENSSRELEQLTQTRSHTWRRDSNKATRPVSYAPARSSPCGRASPAGPGQEPAADTAHGHTGHCTRNHPVSCPVQQDHRPRVTSVPRTDAATKTPASGPEW